MKAPLLRAAVFSFSLLSISIFNQNINAQVCFNPGVIYAASTNPNCVAITDFNGDGKKDLAVANATGSNISIFLGDGTGAFGVATNISSGSGSNSVCSADYNGDGKADIAVAHNIVSGYISVFLGDGLGGFGAATTHSIGTPCYGIFNRDLNNDGKIDIVTANTSSNNISVFLGDGAGGFSTNTNFAVGTSPACITSGDFNMDGKVDLATGNNGSSGNLSILLGDGLGGFGAAANSNVGGYTNGIATGDFNLDGKADLALTNALSNTVSFILGTGTGTFGSATALTVGTNPNSVCVADFNTDGKADIAVANRNTNNVSVLMASGSAAFYPAATFTTGAGMSVNSADFNTDGKPDLAIANYSSSNISVLNSTTLPVVTANTSTTTVCAGGQITLTGSGVNSYYWTGGATDGVAFAPGASTTYTVVGTQTGGCTNVATKSITVNALPTVTANATTVTVCAGGTVTLTGGGASTYTWSGGVTNGTAFTPPTGTTIYTVTGTNALTCTNTATKSITVNALPTVTANSTTFSVCAGGTVTLTGGGASTYSWTGGVSNGFPFAPASTAGYSVTGTDVNGCKSSASTTVNVNSLPSVGANTSAPSVCAGNTITLSGSGATTYTWSNGVTDGVSFAPSSTNTFTVTGSDGICSNKATINIYVNSLPAVTISATSTVTCAQSPVTLNGSGANFYVWSGGVSNGFPFYPTSTDTYTITGIDGNGCSNTNTVTIAVNALPIVTASATANAVCTGNFVTLTGGGALTYTWSNSVVDGNSFSPSSTNTYTVTGTDGNNCVNTATISVTVNGLPLVTANSSSATVCEGSSVTLTGGGATSYSWTGGVVNATPFNATTTTDYTVTGIDANNCMNTATITVNVNSLPLVIANANPTAVCLGGTITLSGSGASTYTWNSGVTDGVAFTPTTGGTYSVSGTDVNGCVNTATISVTVNSLPSVTANASNTVVCAGSSVILSGGGATTYTWSNGVNNGVVFTPVAGNTYTVTGTDVNNCVNSATVTVGVNAYPNVNTSYSIATVSANQNGAAYQWVDCANSYSAIPSETNQAFTPSVNGSYAVVVSLGGCADTSSCVSVTNVRIQSFGNSQAVKVYPNPAKNHITIDLGSNGAEMVIEIRNSLGQLVHDEKTKASKTNVVIEGLPPGVYTVFTGGKYYKFVKE